MARVGGQTAPPPAWPAPFHPGPVDATVRLPGSKSLTNRYLLLAALGDEPARIARPLVARDTILMARALAGMGTRLVEDDRGLVVSPAPLGGAKIDAGLAGTVMRFVPAVAMLADGDVSIDGDPRARLRPVDPVVRAIQSLGVAVSHAVDADGRAVLPFTVHGTGHVEGGVATIDATGSSQFVSALLLAAPRMGRGLDLRHRGGPIPSAPHLEMTCELLRSAGIAVAAYREDGSPAGPGEPAARWVVEPGVPRVGEATVEPDLSNAGPFLAAAMVTGGRISIPDWPARTTQGGDALRRIFAAMGGRVGLETARDGDGPAPTATLRIAGPRHIAPLEADMRDVGELAPTVAAVAAFATGPSALRNIGHLRAHETDRLAAIAAELGRAGGRASIDGGDLLIDPAPLRAARLESYGDHRMATFGAILGLRTEGVEVAGIETTAKTLPQFAQMWQDLAADGTRSAPAVVEPAPVAASFAEGELPA